MTSWIGETKEPACEGLHLNLNRALSISRHIYKCHFCREKTLRATHPIYHQKCDDSKSVLPFQKFVLISRLTLPIELQYLSVPQELKLIVISPWVRSPPRFINLPEFIQDSSFPCTKLFVFQCHSLQICPFLPISHFHTLASIWIPCRTCHNVNGWALSSEFLTQCVWHRAKNLPF